MEAATPARLIIPSYTCTVSNRPNIVPLRYHGVYHEYQEFRSGPPTTSNVYRVRVCNPTPDYVTVVVENA
eukprot:609591-Prorocentrum_minimum.AAC.2